MKNNSDWLIIIYSAFAFISALYILVKFVKFLYKRQKGQTEKPLIISKRKGQTRIIKSEKD